MGKLLLVGCGGFIGSVLRYAISGFVHHWIKRDDLPFGTLVVNVVGCLFIGLLSQLAEARSALTPETRAFVIIGILGGFTTYSSFANETVNLGRDGQATFALGNIAAQLILGLGAVWLGRIIGHKIWG